MSEAAKTTDDGGAVESRAPAERSGGRRGILLLLGVALWGAGAALDLAAIVVSAVRFPGAGVPFALLLALGLDGLLAALLLLPLAALLWAAQARRAGGATHPLRSLLDRRDSSPLALRARARLLASLLCLLGLGYAWLRASLWLLDNVHDHPLGAAAWTLGGLASLVAAWLLSLVVTELLLRRLPRRALGAAPTGVAGLTLIIAPIGALLASSWVGLGRIPWREVGALALLGAAAGGAWWASRRVARLARALERWRASRGLLLLGAAALLTLLGGLGAEWTSRSLWVVGEQTTVASRGLTLARTLTDVDLDGYSGLLGGGDCAPWDPSRHPGAREIPDNGIDENCVGGDLRKAAIAGPIYHEDHPLLRDERPWSVVLLILDAVRADHVSFLGYERKTTPSLDALAEQSLVFPRAYSPSATTRFSVPALLTGRHPSGVAWTRRGRNLFLKKGANRMLGERLQAAGYFTGAVTCSYDIFEPSFGLSKGFERYDSRSVRYRSRRSISGRTARQAADATLRLFEQAGERPFFTYTHFMDPHAPYDDPGGPTFGERDIDRYDAEILSTDAEVARIIDALSRRPDADRIILIVSADHGDQFGERGRKGHGRYVYDEEVHVPLLIHIPGLGGQRIERSVSLVDLAPTIANLARTRDAYDRFEGRNLLGLLPGGTPDPRPTVVETWPFAAFRERRVALVRMPHKLIFNFRDRTREVYDLLEDPGERRDLYDRLPRARRLELQEELDGWLERHRMH